MIKQHILCNMSVNHRFESVLIIEISEKKSYYIDTETKQQPNKIN